MFRFFQKHSEQRPIRRRLEFNYQQSTITIKYAGLNYVMNKETPIYTGLMDMIKTGTS
jgi:hypothetical protein